MATSGLAGGEGEADDCGMVISPAKPATSLAQAMDDGSDGSSSDDDDFFDRMVAHAARKGEGSEDEDEEKKKGGQPRAPSSSSLAAAMHGEEEEADDQWCEAMLHHAATTSVVRDENDEIWGDVLRIVLTCPQDPAHGRVDGVFGLDTQAKQLLLRRFLQETGAFPRAIPFVNAAAAAAAAGGTDSAFQWHVDNLVAPKAAVGLRRVGGTHAARDVFVHAMDSGAAASVLSGVLQQAEAATEAAAPLNHAARWNFLHLDPLHEAAVTAVLERHGLRLVDRTAQRLFLLTARPPAPSPTLASLGEFAEPGARGDASLLPCSPPQPARKRSMPSSAERDDKGRRSGGAGASGGGGGGGDAQPRQELSVRPLSPTEQVSLLLAPAVCCRGTEAHGLWHEGDLVCVAWLEKGCPAVRRLWTPPPCRGRGFERHLLFALVKRWRAADNTALAAAMTTTSGQPPQQEQQPRPPRRRPVPMVWLDVDDDGEDGQLQQQRMQAVLAGLGFAPLEGAAGAGVTLQCTRGGEGEEEGMQ